MNDMTQAQDQATAEQIDLENPLGVDGFEVCRRLRGRPHGQRLPIVMMTAADDTESIGKAYALGATDFVTNDQTLTYSGGLPAAFNSTTERVLVEIVNSANVVVSKAASASLLQPGGTVTFTITRSGSGTASTVYVSTTPGTADVDAALQRILQLTHTDTP